MEEGYGAPDNRHSAGTDGRSLPTPHRAVTWRRLQPFCVTERVLSRHELTDRHRQTLRDQVEGVKPTDRDTLEAFRGWGG